jgi:hypothetical protein
MPIIVFPRPERAVDVSFLHLLPVIFFNLYLIITFYLNAYLLIPKLYIKRKFFLYFLSIAYLLLQFLFLPQFTNLGKDKFGESLPRSEFFRSDSRINDSLSDKNKFEFRENMRPEPPAGAEFNDAPPPPRNFFMVKRFAAISMFLLILLLSSMYRISSEWFILNKRNKEVEAERVNTELHLLKAQINPHFLFNTLNSLYILALKKSDKAPEAILKLSDIMRYVLTESSESLVPLDSEIKYLNQYIDLQQLRLTEKVEVQMDIIGNTESYLISPLLFITFIENAFQYGVSTSVESPISILLEVADDKLHFKVVNKIVRSGNKESTGIGIDNSRRKLELLYPNAHTLNISSHNSTFIVDLTINLKA